ncbi:hypothetical protein GCM10027440_00920 [Nocardiopsis coralliicola]
MVVESGGKIRNAVHLHGKTGDNSAREFEFAGIQVRRVAPEIGGDRNSERVFRAGGDVLAAQAPAAVWTAPCRALPVRQRSTRRTEHAEPWRAARRARAGGGDRGMTTPRALRGRGGPAGTGLGRGQGIRSERIRKRWPVGASREKPLPRPGTTSTVRRVWLQ